MKYICVAKRKELVNANGEKLGMSEERALYYSSDIGKRRIYRDSFPTPNYETFKLFKFNNIEKAQKLCDEINEAYNDEFEVRTIVGE